MYQKIQILSTPTTNLARTIDANLFIENKYKNIISSYLKDFYKGEEATNRTTPNTITTKGIENLLSKDIFENETKPFDNRLSIIAKNSLQYSDVLALE
jgi:hypothetical protein